MIVVKSEYRNKGVVVHLRRSSGGVMKIELDSADKVQLKALKDAGYEGVEDSIGKKPASQ